jgi:hypothetical protein
MVSLVHYGETVDVVDSRISSFTTELAIFRYRIIILRKVSMFIHSKNSEIPSKEKKNVCVSFSVITSNSSDPALPAAGGPAMGNHFCFYLTKT